MDKLNWQNLKENKCPRCGGELQEPDEVYDTISCEHCSFTIHEDKMEDLIADM